MLQAASKKGCKTLNGLGMLLWQGCFAFQTLWTGKKPPVDVMKGAGEGDEGVVSERVTFRQFSGNRIVRILYVGRRNKMTQSPLRLIHGRINFYPNRNQSTTKGIRGIYVLFDGDAEQKLFDVKYVGMSTTSVRGRPKGIELKETMDSLHGISGLG